MNLIRTDRNFGDLKPRDKINFLKGLAAGQNNDNEAPELKFTVLVDKKGNHKLYNSDEVINLNTWESIENYLKGKYPLNRVSICEIKVDNINSAGAGEIAA